MSIDLSVENDRHISTSDAYAVIDMAMQACETEEGGFLNGFVFERAMYVYAVIVLYPDRKDEVSAGASESVCGEWDALLEDGTISKMVEEYPVDMDFLAEQGRMWFEDYTAYAHSARGILSSFQGLSGNALEQIIGQFQAARNGGLEEIERFADSWGYANATAAENAVAFGSTSGLAMA